ncbi:MAG: hypothetical protein O9284_17275 [Steroidobacteraceae bacterium]|jgi:hypothetical protein|nr:hypothetical protein [Steroidobacteraceae bacterium]
MARGRPLQPLRISPSERERRLARTRRHKSARAVALRARIVLGAAD